MYSFSSFIPLFLIPFIGWGVRRRLRSRNEWAPPKKQTFYIGISAYFVTEMARSFYRPWVYASGLDDFHLADTLGNSAGSVTAIFMILTMAGKGRWSDFGLVGIVFGGLILYEVISANPGGRIDLWDVYATVVFSVASAAVYYRILKSSLAEAEADRAGA